MKAIPTTYKGVNYRSMLEARYAAWFDLSGIRADYEPEAFDGYIPDFMLSNLRCQHHMVVEVKGRFESFDLAKIRRSGWGRDGYETDEREQLYKQLLSKPWDRSEIGRARTSAILDDIMWAESPFWGNILVLDGRGPSNATLFWRSPANNYQGTERRRQIDLFYNPEGVVGSREDSPYWMPKDATEDTWLEAGNLVQWRGARTKTG